MPESCRQEFRRFEWRRLLCAAPHAPQNEKVPAFTPHAKSQLVFDLSFSLFKFEIFRGNFLPARYLASVVSGRATTALFALPPLYRARSMEADPDPSTPMAAPPASNTAADDVPTTTMPMDAAAAAAAAPSTNPNSPSPSPFASPSKQQPQEGRVRDNSSKNRAALPIARVKDAIAEAIPGETVSTDVAVAIAKAAEHFLELMMEEVAPKMDVGAASKEDGGNLSSGPLLSYDALAEMVVSRRPRQRRPPPAPPIIAIINRSRTDRRATH